jgi:hypothetical protein
MLAEEMHVGTERDVNCTRTAPHLCQELELGKWQDGWGGDEKSIVSYKVIVSQSDGVPCMMGLFGL